MSQYPIIIKPSSLAQALSATPKPEPFYLPVIPTPGTKPKRFKMGLLIVQAVVFTGIALVPALFAEFILAAVLFAVTVGVILDLGKLPLVRQGQKNWELEQEMHLW